MSETDRYVRINRDHLIADTNLVEKGSVTSAITNPSSGTLWSRYNLGVNPTKLLVPEDWYGNYYAWGELEPNKTKDHEIYFDWDNYKNYKYNKLTKYCNNPKYGLNRFTDNLTQLLPDDDVAYQNKKYYNYKFHIPTKQQCEELIKYTKNYWVNNYNPNKLKHNPEDDKGIKGLNGMIFEGKNGNQLFIPAAGYYYGSNIENIDSYCGIWTSSFNLDYSYYAYILQFKDSDTASIDDCNKCIGLNVCPVINL